MTDWVELLLESTGQDLLAELSSERLTPARELQLIPKLRKRFDAPLVTRAVEQTKLRQRAASKFSKAGEMFFTRDGLEQASSERMAQHHARRYEPFDRIADLCCGIGGDLVGLAQTHRTLAVDMNREHLDLALHNAHVYGCVANVEAVCADVRQASLDGVSAAFIDPARRAGGERLRTGDSEPPLDWCFALGERMPLAIKAAPGLPLDLVPHGWEIEFVSEGRELKEAVLWSPAFAGVGRRATLLPAETSLTNAEAAALDVRKPGRFLLDPDPAITRAGLVAQLGAQLGECWQIDPEIAFLSSDRAMPTPFGRLLRIEASMPWSLNRLREALRSLDVGVVDIRKRGSAVDVDELAKRLRLSGSRAATVVLTRSSGKPWALVCSPNP